MPMLNAEQFLARVWPQKLLTNEMLELRWINRAEQDVHRKFFTDVPELLRCAQTHKDCEVYFGVSTRYGNGGKKRDCYRTQAVWADLDGRRINDCDLDPKPDILVDSGGGSHAYWLFPTPMLVRDERWQEIEAVNRALCHRFKADITAIDTGRILRIPGFYNHKYDTPRLVRAYAI